MKKILVTTLVVAGVAAGGLAIASSASAYTNNSRFHKEGFGHEKMLEKKAELLNLSVEELEVKLEEGKTFKDIAEEQGITTEEMRNKMLEQAKERWENRGLSEEEIGERETRMQERWDKIDTGELEHKGFPGFHYRMGLK